MTSLWAELGNGYIVLNVQGNGSFGQVIKAYSVSLNKFVAIKFIKNAFDSVQIAKRIYREVAILRQLSQMEGNVHTTELLDVVVSQNKGLFLVMGYYEHDLEQIVKRK